MKAFLLDQPDHPHTTASTRLTSFECGWSTGKASFTATARLVDPQLRSVRFNLAQESADVAQQIVSTLIHPWQAEMMAARPALIVVAR